MGQIVVTPRSMSAPIHPSLDRLREAGYEVITPAPGKQPDEQQLIEALKNAQGYLAGVERISRSIIEAAPQLRVISRNGVGVDNIDMKAAREHGISVMRTEGVNANGVAELTIAHLFAACRRLDYHASSLKTHTWQRRKGCEVKARTMGIIGYGRIGRLVGDLCRGLGMKVCAFDPFIDVASVESAGIRFVTFPELLQCSDIVSLHAPVPEDGKPVLDRAALNQAKRGVIVLNTARYELLDAPAVRDALDDGTVSVLTLDAFQSEPPDDWSLVDHENVLATPHIGGFTAETVDRVAEAAVENVLKVLKRE